MGPWRSPLSRVVVVVDIDAQSACDSGGVRQYRHLVNGNVKLGRAAARCGEWAQHFSNASCLARSAKVAERAIYFLSI